jgi:hypothetical protein
MLLKKTMEESGPQMQSMPRPVKCCTSSSAPAGTDHRAQHQANTTALPKLMARQQQRRVEHAQTDHFFFLGFIFFFLGRD